MNLKVCTYNCKHFRDIKLPFVEKLFNSCTFLLLQEHCLFSSQFEQFSKVCDHVCYSASSAMDENELLIGRPHGGCAILWNSKLEYQVDEIKCESKRLCAINVYLKEKVKLLIINVYMPCDERRVGRNLEVYNDTLGEIMDIINKESPMYFVLGGDYNTDLNRKSPQTEALNNFLSNGECVMCDESKDVSHTYRSVDGQYFSHIDHIIASLNMKDEMKCCQIVDCVDNFSDHVALSCTWAVPVTFVTSATCDPSPQCKWSKATSGDIENYKNLLDDQLANICIPGDLLLCKDFNCNVHNDVISKLYTDIVDACIKAGENSIPQSSNTSKKKKIPGWSDSVEPLRQRALMWHAIWQGQGSPREGHIAAIMRSTRALYHKEIKNVKRNEKYLRNIKMAECVNNNSSRDLWEEVKRMKPNAKTIPSKIDNVTGDKNIANLFADKFKNLYNSVKYNQMDMKLLQDEVNDGITCKCVNEKCEPGHGHIHRVTISDIKKAINRIKKGKKDCYMNIFTDSLICGTNRLFCLISLLFTVLLRHGVAPIQMLGGTMMPIPKIKGTVKSENFRAITLCSTMCKLFDAVLLVTCEDSFITSNLQFGFKKRSSTGTCTFLVQEMVSFYNDHGSNVYCCLLDASKAFDRLEFCTLFRKLLKRKFCPLVIRLLLFMYLNQKLCVKWSATLSDEFTVSNGVKQGGIISPYLFCIYVDDLLEQLRKSGVGCYAGPHFCGAIGYADDIVILCPTVTGMKKMLSICEQYAQSHLIKFNGTKSKLITFVPSGGSRKNPDLYFCGEKIPNVNKVEHLGHRLSINTEGQVNISYIKSKFIGSFNDMYANLGNVPSTILYRLFHQYCCSFYGVILCNIRSESFEELCTAYRKIIRKVFKLPHLAHSNILPLVCKSHDLYYKVLKRVLKFYISLHNDSNILVQFVAQRCKYSCVSNMGKNVYMFSKNTRMESRCAADIDLVVNQVYMMYKTECARYIENNVNETRANVIIELIDTRDGLTDCQLTATECSQLVEYLCTI